MVSLLDIIEAESICILYLIELFAIPHFYGHLTVHNQEPQAQDDVEDKSKFKKYYCAPGFHFSLGFNFKSSVSKRLFNFILLLSLLPGVARFLIIQNLNVVIRGTCSLHLILLNNLDQVLQSHQKFSPLEQLSDYHYVDAIKWQLEE